MIGGYPDGVIATIFCFNVLLSCIYIFILIRCLFYKKYIHFIISLSISLFMIFILQVMSSFIKRGDDKLSIWFKELNLYIYIIALVIISFIAPIFLLQLFKYSKKNISSNSIRKGFDASNDGFLYFDNDGACLLINKKMEEIASLITKNYILNGFDFLNIVKDKQIILSNGKTYKFINKEISIDNSSIFYKYEKETINELVALDVTELVLKNDLLVSDNLKLKEMNKELEAYNQKTLEVIRHKEILSAKINIHNEMNKLVLQSSYLLDNDNNEEKNKLLSKWENNTLLLCKEALNNNVDYIDDLKNLAEAIGVKIKCNDYSLIKSNDLISLFVLCTKESLLNVAKHTKEKELIIDIKNNNDLIIMSFINDNNNIKSIIKGGGLNNIEKYVEKLNGKMDIINDDKFILRIEVKDV